MKSKKTSFRQGNPKNIRVFALVGVVAVFSLILIAGYSILYKKSYVQNMLPKQWITIDKSKSKYTFQPNYEQQYDKGIIIFWAYVNKADLRFDLVGFDYVPAGFTAGGPEEPEFVLEKYGFDNKTLINYQGLSAPDGICPDYEQPVPEEDCTLDYWTFSDKLPIEPETVYWRILTVDGKKVADINVHIELLEREINKLPDEAFVNGNRDAFGDELYLKLKDYYVAKNRNEILKVLGELRQEVQESIKDKFTLQNSLQITKKEFLDLISEIETRVSQL